MNSKYGQPQGNELVYGTDIIRRIDTFEFSVIDRFKSSKDAHTAYKNWMTENNINELKKQWHYMRPITGWNENGQPIVYDSWGEKK